MKKTTILSLLLVFMISSTAQALSWAIMFVVWEGKVYEVHQEEIIGDSEIGKNIGKVKTKPDDMTGKYYGDASNYYPIGTKYYKIKGIPTSNAIAVRVDDKWIKAVYVHKAPFHIMNVITNYFFIFSIIVITLIIMGHIFRAKKSKKRI